MAASSLFAADVSADWISVAESRAGARSAGVVAKAFVNGGDVKSASWTVTGLGVFTCYANGDRLATGFVGTPELCEVLTAIGEDKLARRVRSGGGSRPKARRLQARQVH